MNHLKTEFYTRLQKDANIFDFLQNVALDGFWYMDAALPESPFITPRFWVSLGYAYEGPWPECSEAFAPEDFALFKSRLNQWLTEAETASHTQRVSVPQQLVCFRHKNGQAMWFQCTAQVLSATTEQPCRLLLAYTDVTAYQEKERLLTRCNTEAKIGYWEMDLRTGFLFWSDMTKLIYELPLDYEPSLQAGLDFYDADYKQMITAKIERAIQYGEPYTIDLVLHTPSGRKKWTRAIGVPEMRDGVCQRLYGTFQDIDEAKRNQLAREESERKFKGIFDSTFSFIGFLSPEGILLEANQTALSMAGLSATDVIGKPFWECYWWQISAETQRELKQKLRLAAQGQECTYEVEVWIANETPITILFSLRPVLDAEGQVCFIVPEGRPIQDIVDARRRYQSVLDSTQVGTWEWNIENGNLLLNERWAQMIGYRLEELTPLTDEIWESSVHPEDLVLSKQILEACFSRQREYYDMDFRMRHKQGHWVWVQATGKVVSWTAEQQPLIMCGTHQEITARKNNEAEIRHLLNLSQAQNERLNNFAHIVSHNLRSHIFSIEGVLDLLKLEHPELEGNELLMMLKKASKNLSETIADLSEVVTSDLSVVEDKSVVDLYAVVQKNIESVIPLAEGAEMQVVNKVPEKTLVRAVPAYLESLTLNFITNAIKYCAPDRERILEISLHSVDGFDHIGFADNGLGIDLEKYGHKLFEMYQTFHKHEDARGIGLYMTHNQVKSMGGRIEVVSEVNKGTTFWVILPQ